MAVTRKRKHAATGATDEMAIPSTQKRIKAYTTVGKPRQHDLDKTAKRDDLAVDPHSRTSDPITIGAMSLPKRKRSIASDAEEDASSASFRFFKQFAKSAEQGSNPPAKRVRDVPPPTPSETPSKRAVAMLDRMNLNAVKAIPFALEPKSTAYDTPPQTPEESHELPPELIALTQLHSAFVSALSLYHAHNGAATSAEVQQLLPIITKTWNSRCVTLEDLRRILAFHTDDFGLEYCGQAGVRLITLEPRGRKLTRVSTLVDAESLRVRFEASLHRSWDSWMARAQPGGSVDEFLDHLPLAEMRKNEAAQAAAPLRARGQQRLAALRAGQAAVALAAETKHTATQPKAEDKTLLAVQNRGSSLLDRVLAKQALIATTPLGPSKEQQERKAALHRIEDVTRVLNLLSGTKLRASFSMQSITQHLQQSLRNPISRNEVERCLRLMSQEVTPGFVTFMQSGAVLGVVVSRTGRIGLEELRARIAAAVA